MGSIKKYAEKSTLMNINISYGDESFSFNLNRELIISEDKINHELKVQPSSFAFISMLHKKLLRVAKDKKAEMDKTFAIVYTNHKSKIDPDTKRPYPKESANYMATKSVRYQNAIKEYHEAEYNANIIETCVKGFEQRAFLIQTISANLRKEK